MHKFKGKKYFFTHQRSSSHLLRTVSVGSSCLEQPPTPCLCLDTLYLGHSELGRAWRMCREHQLSFHGSFSRAPLYCLCPLQCDIWNKLHLFPIWFCYPSTYEELILVKFKGRTWTFLVHVQHMHFVELASFHANVVPLRCRSYYSHFIKRHIQSL